MTAVNNDSASSIKKQTKQYSKKIPIDNTIVEFVCLHAPYKKIGDEDVFLDQISIDFMFEDIALSVKNNLSQYNQVPKTIVISNEEVTSFSPSTSQPLIETSSTNSNEEVIAKKQTSVNLIKGPVVDNSKGENTEEPKIEVPKEEGFVKRSKPKYKFEDVYVDDACKNTILSALIMAKQRDKLYIDWGLAQTLKNGRSLVLNFYGPPGTGKTMMAEAICNYLDKDLYTVNYSELESGTPGDTPKNIVKVFKLAKQSGSVLLFDEADSFLGKRLSSVASAADTAVNITRSVMLIEIEKFDGVIIFTTNFISNYDVAFKRRILASVEFRLPDEEGRKHIWNSHLPDKLPLVQGIISDSLASRYGGTSGADIKDIILFAAVNCLEKGRELLSWEDFEEAYRSVKNRYSVV